MKTADRIALTNRINTLQSYLERLYDFVESGELTQCIKSAHAMEAKLRALRIHSGAIRDKAK